jgi:hypothetical protein
VAGEEAADIGLRDIEYLMHAANDSACDSLGAAEFFELLRALLDKQPSIVLQHVTALGGALGL